MSTPFNAGDPAAVAEGLETAEAVRSRDLADLRTLMELPEGNRVLLRLFDQTGPLWAGSVPTDAGVAAHQQGIRWVGLWLVHELMQADPLAAGALLAMHASRER
ncbi:hypothetical protein [Magnetospirillum molischianum]|uniref:Uncharacterized protein n=1 Tax=Magnetospirillum molischianum DSM 120 TaxID=1150626 RepID=H8FP64_MAGML|nr:hypothetical protein [Magnetospirillum molischianum]CCG40152.1 hypothetical protein PHAMO_180121 [Magnetospirillum molischianum DSM 120]